MPDRLAQQFNILDYGADPEGKEDSTAAFCAAFEAAMVADGGGIVYFPKGDYKIPGLYQAVAAQDVPGFVKSAKAYLKHMKTVKKIT